VALAIVDTGPLYAVADADDDDHERCIAVLEDPSLQLVVPALVVAEATYLIGTRLGPRAEAMFLRGIGELDVEAPSPADWPRIAALVTKYGDFPLGGTDASVIVLAERRGTDLVVTLDRRHFGAVRPKHVKALRLLP
jgi:predicted nucleic acid-binding protein